MQKFKLFETEMVPGPYPGIEHYPIASKKNGFTQFEIISSKTPKGCIGHMHSHPGLEHMQIVLSGSLRINTPDGYFDLGPGEGILMRPGEQHEVVNTYDGTTEYLVVYSPPRD